MSKLQSQRSFLSHSSIQKVLRSAINLTFVLALILSACSRDPNVRMQKFVSQGNAYFKEGKYLEARILYSRALQIDPRNVIALYKNAQCSEHLGNWNAAYQELARTVVPREAFSRGRKTARREGSCLAHSAQQSEES